MIVIKLQFLWVVLIYLGACGLIGLIGRRRKLGGWAYFFASICLTPVVGALMIAVSDQRQRS